MLIPPGFCEVTWCWQQAAGYREACTSFGFGISGWDEDVEGIYNGFDIFTDGMGLPSTFLVTRAVVKVGTSNPSAPITFEFAGSAAGSGSGAMATPAVSLMATKQTNLGGRHGRGRNFLPSPPEGQVDNVGQVDSTYRGNVKDAWQFHIEGMAGVLGDSSAPLGYLLHADATEPTEITGVDISGKVASQRRRQVR